MIGNAYKYLRGRRTLLMAGVLAVSCVTLWAQPDGPGGPPPDGPPPGDMQQSHGPSVDRELKQLTRLLTLTADQQTQVKALLTDQHQQMETLFKQQKPAKDSDSAAADNSEPPSADSMKAMHDAMKTIREATNTKISALLTADQQTKFTAWKEKQEKTAERQGDDMPPPPPDGGPDGGGGPPPGGGGPPGV